MTAAATERKSAAVFIFWVGLVGGFEVSKREGKESVAPKIRKAGKCSWCVTVGEDVT